MPVQQAHRYCNWARSRKDHHPSGEEDGMTERLLTIQEVCAKLGGVKPWTIRCWVSQKRIPYTKVGRLTRFPESRIDAWIQERTVLPLEE